MARGSHEAQEENDGKRGVEEMRVVLHPGKAIVAFLGCI